MRSKRNLFFKDSQRHKQALLQVEIVDKSFSAHSINTEAYEEKIFPNFGNPLTSHRKHFFFLCDAFLKLNDELKQTNVNSAWLGPYHIYPYMIGTSVMKEFTEKTETYANQQKNENLF